MAVVRFSERIFLFSTASRPVPAHWILEVTRLEREADHSPTSAEVKNDFGFTFSNEKVRVEGPLRWGTRIFHVCFCVPLPHFSIPH
jgi:hypothetical protein